MDSERGATEWIIYSTADPESWKLWRIGISPRGVIDEKPELVASGNGGLGPGGSASEDGKLAYNIWSSTVSIYQISISDRGQKLAPTLQLPLPEGGWHSSPSVSRDGRWMAYDSSSPGKPNTIVLRDMSTGTDHVLDDKGRQETVWPGRRNFDLSGRVKSDLRARMQSRAHGRTPIARLPCGFMVAAAGGQPEQICEHCTPRGFSSDGSVVLLQKYDLTDWNKARIVALDLQHENREGFPESSGCTAFSSLLLLG